MSNESRLTGLSKQSHLVATGLLLSGSILASGAAQADALLVQTFDLNEKTASNGSFDIDLNNDGFNDFRVFVKEGDKIGKNFASIRGLNKGGKLKPISKAAELDEPFMVDPRAVGRVLVDVPFVDSPAPAEGDIKQEIILPVIKGSAFVKRLDEGDSVDAWSGAFFNEGQLYSDGRVMQQSDVAVRLAEVPTQFGPFSTEGDRGYIGLSLTFGEEDLWLNDGILQLSSEEVDQEIRVIDDMPMRPVTHYGWIEVVRGSVTAIRTGFQTVANVAAPIPAVAVSEPATLPLIALGAAGLVALRRRKQAA